MINSVLCPNYIKAISEYVRFEQRIGGPKKNILDFLEDSLEKAIKNDDEFATIFLTVNTCRFHFATDQDLDLIFDIYSDSVKSFRNSKPLFLNFIKLLETISSTENKLYSRSFEIIEKATLDAKASFELADRKQIASVYLAWLKQHCKQQTYIDLVEERFVKAGLTDSAPNAGGSQTNGATYEQPAQDYPGTYGQTEEYNQPPHAGEKRIATDQEPFADHNQEESYKRQKTEE